MLRAQTATVHATYEAARYREAIELLPALLAAVDAIRRTPAGLDRRESLLTYVNAYVVTAKLVTKLGAADLAMVAADRSVTASLDAVSLGARGLPAYQVACALLRADRSDEAEHLAVAMAEQVQSQAHSDAPGAGGGSLTAGQGRTRRNSQDLWIGVSRHLLITTL